MSVFDEVIIGNLDDVKEQKTIIPPTKNVRVKIVKAENRVNKDNTYRSISLQLRIVDGVGDENKWKGKILFGSVNYYADPTVYTKDFFTSKQHLIQLKYLARATGIGFSVINEDKFKELVGLEVLCDITTRKRIMMVDGVEEVTLENEVKNFKALDLTTTV